jgi:hypothetical protein
VKRVLVVVLVVLLAPLAADAQTPSPRWGSFELSAGKYRPDIDSEFSSSPGPYRQVFGGGRGWMFQLGVSKSLYTGLGSLEAGVRTGYFEDTGRGFETGTTVPTGESTAFRIVPSSVALTYRFDWPVERYRIPLAPYVRAAFERYNWWVSGGDGTSERGATNGWSATAGLAFLLDIVDRGLARELDRDTGVNHTYVFAEITRSSVDDFGSGSSWDLSNEDLGYAFGLLFVF